MNDILLFWAALLCYVGSAISFSISVAFVRPKAVRFGFGLATGGLFLHTVSLALRWSLTGHGPYITPYEVLSSSAWAAVALFLLFWWQVQKFHSLGTVVMPVAFLLMGLALTGGGPIKGVPPSAQSAWLIVHIIFAKLTVASMLLASGMAVVFLVRARRTGGAEYLSGPGTDTGLLLDNMYRFVTFGFIALTLMIITGSMWAHYLWNSYWEWDPTETWSLVAWIVYGIYLHGRITFRWQEKYWAWYLILSFPFLLAVFFIIPFFVKSQHTLYMSV